ncbi:MAG: AEC family transporter [Spirochaetales bacterium]|uniref:AEC family transporter n=1 Tax=Candidatus Thalassospirochaeta sargassi TaxID=3119039 RepID=A0AAJ1IAD3_9SPIO|nr:AEC family transporter [Spirochaetales bacterium]
MEIFLHILTHNIIPIFILIGTGALIGWRFKLDVTTLSKINFYAFMPFYAFVVIYTNDLSANMAVTLLFSILFLFINAALAYLTAAARRMGSRKKHALANSIMFYNTGNIGIPLITLIYAGTPWLNQALVIQITIMLFIALTTNTIGFYNAGRGSMHWKDSIFSVLKMPAIWAILSASLLKHFDFDLQTSFIWPAFIYLKQAMIGFVLVTLGVQLSATKIKNRDPDVAVAVILRLLLSPTLGLLILKLLRIDGLTGQVLFVSSSAPTAVTAALIAIERNCEPEFASKTALFSTILCSVSLVFVVYFSKILFPV